MISRPAPDSLIFLLGDGKMHIHSSLHGSIEHSVNSDGGEPALARRGNRRRLRVFLMAFFVVLLTGLTWDFLRPAEYRATARVQISPGSIEPHPSLSARENAEPSPHTASDLLTQVQVLTSRPLLARVSELLAQAGYLVGAADEVTELQKMITVVPVSGTEIVELQATGAPPELLAAALNTLLDAYREELKASYETATGVTLTQARTEAALLDRAVHERRARLEAFRSQHGVWSSERDGNEAVGRMKGLTTALATASEKAALAEAHVRTLREAIAAGNSGSSRAKDDPTLANMEQRASALREQIRDMEHTYTPRFMSIDPGAKALQARLKELEQQIEGQRSAGRQASLATALEELASARDTVSHLQAQINEQRRGVQTYSERFTQAKSLEDDLAQIEKANREAQERLVKLEASERSRLPALNLVELASVPQSSFRPPYLRDAALVVAAAFVCGLLAMWFVELFNRSPPTQAPASTTVVIPQPWAMPHLLEQTTESQQLLPVANSHSTVLLPARSSIARELTQSEAKALLTASVGEVRFIISVLLMGLTPEETIDLRQEDLDPVANTLRVRGHAPRTLTVPAWLAACQSPPGNGVQASLVTDAVGAPITPTEIESVLACAAFDAGLARSAEVTAAALRHTCVAWLVRQGVRFSDLASLVGRPNAEALAFYADLAPQGTRRTISEIDPLMPALREIAA